MPANPLYQRDCGRKITLLKLFSFFPPKYLTGTRFPDLLVILQFWEAPRRKSEGQTKSFFESYFVR